jgi:hypothetical protein
MRRLFVLGSVLILLWNLSAGLATAQEATAQTKCGGTIVDEQGKPIDGVTVVIWWYDRPGHLMRSSCTTDAQGRWQVALSPEARDIDIQLAHSEYLSDQSERTDKPPLSRLRDGTSVMVMKRGLKVSGRVLDDETGKPLTDFELAEGILWPGDAQPYWRDTRTMHSEDGAFTVTIDHFVVRSAPPSCAVRIRAAGYVPETSPLVMLEEKPTPFIMRLQRGQVWSGFVHDSSDRPVPKATVAWIGPKHTAFIKDGQLQPQFMSSPEWGVQTDPRGHFELPPARTDGLILALHDTGYGWWRSQDFARDSVVHLTAWSRIAGAVRRAGSDDHATPLRLQLADPAVDVNSLPLRWLFDVASQRDGQFACEFVPALRLAIGHVSEEKFFLADYITPKPGQTCEITIQVEPGPAALRPLAGRALPALGEIGVESAAASLQDHRMLLCFFDMQQRPSRNCLQQLGARARELQGKGIVVVAVQTVQVDPSQLDKWIKDTDISFPVGTVRGDEEKTRSAWGVRSLPWLILTDKNHTVTAEGLSLDDLDILLKREK